MLSVDAHILAHDFEQLLPFAIRHYAALGARITVHDGGPKGVNRELVESAGAKWEFWDTAGQLNDELARKLKNDCWRGTTANWVAVVDADELLHFPQGLAETLDTFEMLGAAVIKPHGFEMFSDVWFEAAEHPGAQITDLVPFGAPDDEWYAKPILWSPRRVCDPGFGIGAHESRAVLFDGRVLRVNRNYPKSNPPVNLLHFHQCGSAERVAARYDATRKRLSAINERMRWGNFQSGEDHVAHKRARILPNLRRVVS